jgi:hypothetical protein
VSAKRSLGPAVARFFETYLVHPKGAHYGEPFRLEPWQREFVDEAYRVDERGRRVPAAQRQVRRAGARRRQRERGQRGREHRVRRRRAGSARPAPS